MVIQINTFSFSGGDWFCPSCKQEEEKDVKKGTKKKKKTKQKTKKTPDTIFAYSRALAWYGLVQRAHTDAERENDGPAILAFWKIDLIQFWEHGHTKYLILAIRILAGLFLIQCSGFSTTYLGMDNNRQLNRLHVYNFPCQGSCSVDFVGCIIHIQTIHTGQLTKCHNFKHMFRQPQLKRTIVFQRGGGVL